MKWLTSFKYRYLAALSMGFGLILSCTETGGIIDDDYPVPQIYWTGNGEFARIPESNSYPFVVDEENKRILITLGFSSSGLQDRDAFTVNFALDREAIGNLQEQGSLNHAIELAPEVIELPPPATVAQGEEGALVQIALNMDALGGFDDDILAFAVRLESASKYPINPDLATLVVLVNYRGVVGVFCPDDAPAPGRVFIPFETADDINAWQYGGLTPSQQGEKQVTITRNNDDGYGIAVKWDQSLNLADYPHLAMRVYDTPANGAWLLKLYDGLADHVIRPENGAYKELEDGSRIYYWNLAEASRRTGELNANIQVVIEGPNGESLTYGWIKSYPEQEIILQCVSE